MWLRHRRPQNVPKVDRILQPARLSVSGSCGFLGWVSGPFEHILPVFEKLLARLQARHGVYAILGNHDCADMVEAFEALGIDVLINQTRTIRRGRAQIHVTGTDDVHYYYTDAARTALEAAPKGFKIALIHSAELADVAAEAGFSLYLAGHTRGPSLFARRHADHHPFELPSPLCLGPLAAWLDDRLHHDRDRGFRVASPVQHARGSCLDHPSPNIGFYGKVSRGKSG